MKKIKFLLPVLAFVFAVGAALATSSNSVVVADFNDGYTTLDCSGSTSPINNSASIQCDFPTTSVTCKIGTVDARQKNGAVCSVLYQQ